MFVESECAKKSLTGPVRLDSYAALAHNFLFIMTESLRHFPDGFKTRLGCGVLVGCVERSQVSANAAID